MSGSAYASHWDRQHAKDEHGHHEWHARWEEGEGGLAALLEPYLLSLQGSSASKGLVVADLGCGSSLLGHQLARHCGAPTHLLLLDASPLPLIRSRQTHCATPGPPDRQSCAAPAEAGARLPAQAVAVEPQQAPPHVGPQAEEQQAGCGTGLGGGAGCAVSWVQGDCRALPLRCASVDLLLDKGTLDALWSDTERGAMLVECARLLAPPCGLLASVSFASRARLDLLAALGPALGLRCRLHVLGEGDPARGHEVRFLALLGRDFGAVPHDPSALTCALLARLAASGSLLESDDEASPFNEGEGGTLFDA